IQRVRITPALRTRLASVGARRLVHRGAGGLIGMRECDIAETARRLRHHEQWMQRLRSMVDHALPHWRCRMEAPLAVAYVDGSERAPRYLYDNNQREPSD